MLGIEDYGSGSDSNESDCEESSVTLLTEKTPASSNPSTSRPKRPLKKITIGLPSLSPNKDDQDDALKDERPVAKKPRLQSGAGASSLLSILPAPKQKNPLPSSSDRERVLGGGKGPGLVFSTPAQSVNGASDIHGHYHNDTEDHADPPPASSSTDAVSQHSTGPHLFLPPSLAKGKPSISAEEGIDIPRTRPRNPTPAIDFFSLEGSTKTAFPTASTSTSSLPSLSSAPPIPTFEPPEPSQNDPYPGYYQLPSGAWAAHDPDVYAKYIKKWESEYNAHLRALEKGAAKGFEDLDKAAVEEVDAMKEMERAKVELKEREERKAVTKGAGEVPVAPKMTLNASKLSGIARSRHQLSTLLKEAYENREALEERIAQGRRNRKEAGNKYGF